MTTAHNASLSDARFPLYVSFLPGGHASQNILLLRFAAIT
jgi:hypothetical protein